MDGIHDYKVPFEISEDISIEDSFIKAHADEIIRCFGIGGIRELADRQNDFIVHRCNNEVDLAFEYIKEGLCEEIPEHPMNYLDYERTGREIMDDGNFREIGGCLVEYIE